MPTYRYNALDSKGNENHGTLEAASSKEAISLIRRQGLFPTKVRLASGSESQNRDKPTVSVSSNENQAASYMPIGMQKCKYNNIIGQLRFLEASLVFDAIPDKPDDLQSQTNLSIRIEDITDVKRKGLLRRSLLIKTQSGQEYLFTGNIGTIANILDFELAQRNR